MPVLVDRAIHENYNIVVFPIHEKWRDIGSPEDYYDSENKNY